MKRYHVRATHYSCGHWLTTILINKPLQERVHKTEKCYRCKRRDKGGMPLIKRDDPNREAEEAYAEHTNPY